MGDQMNNNDYLTLSIIIITVSVFFFIILHGPQGSDAYAYLSYACTGSQEILRQLSTIWTIYPCTFTDYAIISAICAFVLCFSIINILGKHTDINLSTLPIILFALTPLFFSMIIGQPNQIMGVTISFLGLLLLEEDIKKGKILSAGIIVILLSYLFWQAAPILLIVPILLRYDKKNKMHKIGLILLFFILGIVLWTQVSGLITQMFQSPSAEQMSGLGIFFVIPFIIVWDKIPKNIQTTAAVFTIMGLIHAKYMFLAVPWLATGIVVWLSQQSKRSQTILKWLFIVVFIVSTVFAYFSLFPTPANNDIANHAISAQQGHLLTDAGNGIKAPLYWNYDYKWLMVYKGLPIQKIDGPDFEKDYNSPFYAITRQDDNTSCQIIYADDSQFLKYYLRKC